MKKWLCALLCVTLVGCGNTSAEPASSASPLMEDYTELDENLVFKGGDHDSVEKMLAHGTGVIYFSFPECPWCQKYTPLLQDIAVEADMEVLYYNIYTDKSEDREWYDDIAGMMEEKNPDMSRYDNDGNLLIFMPLVVFVNEGEIIGYDDETCDLNSDEVSPDTYWDEEKVSALEERLLPLFTEVKQAQDEKNEQGCAIGTDPSC